MATPVEFKTDWSKCCLCQQENKEELKSPHSNPTQKETDGYSNIATNIPQFKAINALPLMLDPRRLDEGGGIDDTLRKNNAKYHQSCRLLLNNTKLDRAKKRTLATTTTEETGYKKQRRSSSCSKLHCFLCDKGDKAIHLRKAMTMKLNDRLNNCAKILNDGKLLAKLSAGDIVAQEFKYHPTCLSALYNRERAEMSAKEQSTCEGILPKREAYAIAFSELVTFITESKTATSDDGVVRFKMAELVKLYGQRLEQLGVDCPDLNSTRLKEQLLLHMTEVQAYNDGRDVFIVFHSNIGDVLAQKNITSDAIHLAKAASIIRKDMLSHKWALEKTLNGDSIEEAVPTSLLEFVCMLEHGADIKSQIRYGASKPNLALAQLLQYNCSARYNEGVKTHRHSKDRETPFPVYVGLSVYSRHRNRKLVEMLYDSGISISYDRVLEISAQIGEAVVNQYVEDGVVCPPTLRKGLFTSSAVDNIDHNPTSTTAQTSFHGTGISIFQHPSSKNGGESREGLKLGDKTVKRVPALPESYTNIKPAYLRVSPEPTAAPNGVVELMGSISTNPSLEYAWLEIVNLTEDVAESVSITWSADHASKKRGQNFQISIAALLPLWRDVAHSVATIKHAMDKIRETTEFLNPGQTPVMAADQPLYALAKQIQWEWPEQYGEDKFVIMFGGLHIELAALRSIGTILKDSGWVSALTEADVASSGTAQSFISVSSVTRARHAHQVTACALFKLMKSAYNKYTQDDDGDTEALDFKVWCDKRKEESPQFCFWDLIMTMELAILQMIRSFREADFDLYRTAIAELLPYFYANNNINYARWLPIHLRDMIAIEQQHPDLADEFHKGNFVVHKSQREFSGMSIDQAHEQNNAIIKGEGGAIGLTEDEAALRRWMVAGPEVSRFISVYDCFSGTKDANTPKKHHEDNAKAQQEFFKNVNRLVGVLLDFGNPFQEESPDLLSLDTKDIAHPDRAKLITTHHKRGKEKLQIFINQMEKGSFYKPIKKNDIAFFKQQQAESASKEKTALKEDCQLFSRMFISCQTRGCDLQEFFQYENHCTPAALSDNGRLYSCQKSQLIEELEAKVALPEHEPQTDAIIIDGSAMVNTLPPSSKTTFEEYFKEDILPKMQVYSRKYERTDIVFDTYRESSLKNETRTNRGKGIRRRVTPTTKAPGNWRAFLRDGENKTELFKFLADKISEADGLVNTVVVTKGEDVVSNRAVPQEVTPCNHEEADTRIFVHARSLALQGLKSVIVKANDTDVIVIAVAVMPSLQHLGLDLMWITFGSGQKMRGIPVHDLVNAIGPVQSSAIPFFHAFTGCDTVSAFRGKGKKSAWQTWNVCDEEVSQTFATLSHIPTEVSDRDMSILEKFVVAMYDRSSTATTVNDARLDLFARKQRSYQAIPPTRASLEKHAQRAAYQAGLIWGQATKTNPDIPSPERWGWRKEAGQWKINWTDLPPVASSCQELTKCGCKKGCCGRCKCYRSGLVCTRLCSCSCQI